MQEIKQQGGFTLVELAIVLMIIGLLIGGILRGQEMMENARLQKIISQVASYGGAINIFIDKYSTKPGDMVQAPSRLAGCEAGNTNSCANGNGDGVIGVPVFSWEAGNQAIASENTQFWKHLALAHLITGVKPNASSLEWGNSHPGASIPGGFTVITTQGGGVSSITTGSLVLQLKRSITSGVENNPYLSPKQAAYIDRKMDDGMPQTGDVQSRASGNGADVADCEEKYGEASETGHCGLSFLLNR